METHDTREVEEIDAQIMNMSDVLGDKINELLEYRGISDNGKSMRGGCDEIIMPFIIRKYHEIFHHQLQKAREKEKQRCADVFTDKILDLRDENGEPVPREIKLNAVLQVLDHSELDQEVSK